MTCVVTVRIVALITLVFLSAPSLGGEATRAARSAAMKVEASVAMRDWRTAERILDTALRRCRGHEDSARCETLLLYTRGYLYTARAEAEVERRDAHLEAAANAYRQALTLSPGHRAISARLARTLDEKGETDAAIEVLAPIVRRNGTNGTTEALLLGDFLHNTGRTAEAVDIFKDIAGSDPNNVLARARLVSAYRFAPPDRRTLVSEAVSFETDGHPDLGRDLLELALRDCPLDCDEEEADGVLLYWARLRAGSGTLPADAASNLPSVEQWPSPARIGLDVIFNQPTRVAVSPATEWWRDDWLRRDIATRLLVARAAALQGEGDLNGAIVVLETAASLAPNERSEGNTFAYVDALVPLAGLYAAVGQQDNFDRLVQDLFESKARSYIHEDDAGIQRMHTVLGLIFSEQQRFRSNWADNAIFQLQHALEKAEERGDERSYPELRRRLAEALEAPLADTTQPSVIDKTEARRLYAHAAMEYLDMDDLSYARNMLSRSGHNDLTDGLANVLAAREAGVKAFRLVREESGTTTISSKYAWLKGDAASSLPEDFLARQRFKLFADSGMVALRKGKQSDSLYLQAQAINAVASQTNALQSTLDVARVRAAEQTIQSRGRSYETKTARVTEFVPARAQLDADTLRLAQLYTVPEVNAAVQKYNVYIDTSNDEVVLRSNKGVPVEPNRNLFQKVLRLKPKPKPIPEPTEEEKQAIVVAIRTIENQTKVRFEAPRTVVE